MDVQNCRGRDCPERKAAEEKATAARRLLEVYKRKLETESERRTRAEEQSHIDPLTGAYNRRGLEKKFMGELSKVRRFNRNLALLFIDADNFRAFNTDHGEQTGDIVLYNAVKTISASLRPYDSVHRIGGEEFVVLLPEVQSMKEACKVAERIRTRIIDMEIAPHDGGGKLRATVSIGVAMLGASDDLWDLINDANKAELEAKKAGKNKAFLFLDGRSVTVESVIAKDTS